MQTCDREIEISGQVTSETNALFNQLKSNTNIGSEADMSVSANYFNAAQKKIQLRNTFDVYVLQIIALMYLLRLAVSLWDLIFR